MVLIPLVVPEVLDYNGSMAIIMREVEEEEAVLVDPLPPAALEEVVLETKMLLHLPVAVVAEMAEMAVVILAEMVDQV